MHCQQGLTSVVQTLPSPLSSPRRTLGVFLCGVTTKQDVSNPQRTPAAGAAVQADARSLGLDPQLLQNVPDDTCSTHQSDTRHIDSREVLDLRPPPCWKLTTRFPCGKKSLTNSLSLTVPPFIKMTLRMTKSRPVLELEGFLETQAASVTSGSQTDPSLGSSQDRRSCLRRLHLVHKDVQVILGVDFHQFQAKDLERRRRREI